MTFDGSGSGGGFPHLPPLQLQQMEQKPIGTAGGQWAYVAMNPARSPDSARRRKRTESEEQDDEMAGPAFNKQRIAVPEGDSIAMAATDAGLSAMDEVDRSATPAYMSADDYDFDTLRLGSRSPASDARFPVRVPTSPTRSRSVTSVDYAYYDPSRLFQLTSPLVHGSPVAATIARPGGLFHHRHSYPSAAVPAPAAVAISPPAATAGQSFAPVHPSPLSRASANASPIEMCGRASVDSSSSSSSSNMAVDGGSPFDEMQHHLPAAVRSSSATGHSRRTQQHRSPGLGPSAPSGGKQMLRYTLGYRDDCELCRARTPGHFTHILRTPPTPPSPHSSRDASPSSMDMMI